MTDDTREPADSIEPGETVYDDDGRSVGRVSGLTEEGFEVEQFDDDPETADEESIPGQEFGEGYLMWRCGECGEMGEIEDGIPEECPNCGAPEEAISGVRED
jgi:rubrerythrin